MAGSPSSGSKPEKSMSSRLLTMKFMQRAAASAAANEPSQTPDTPSPKRHRNGQTETQSPATPQSDLEAISAALAAEEERRREAVNRQAAEAGESEWVLDFGAGTQYAPQPRVVTADSLDADDDDMMYGGRQSYGNFKRKKRVVTENGETATVDEDDEDTDAMIKREKAKAERSGPVKLSKLTSISGAGGQPTFGRSRSPSQSKKKRKHK
ncbi:uncharacterized protein LDX57_008433 [Aspergillus melleus]|uniref:uncharacterized protein n=1 Tax=Aspergillus melleus TaxID=138277 RepID=UPI001E8DB290|nr:uncharacterized protein LDX57_008433 [Aspergillus melleus]KAH8430770.1 hypothetical protein LDX57_008433 [Aspergillus melleus]